MTPNLILSSLDDLETILTRYSFLELNVADATRLKKAFLDFKDRVIAKLYTRDNPDMLNGLFAESHINLPILPASSRIPAGTVISNQQGGSNNNRQILLAEHDTRVASFFIKHLHNAGFVVMWASHEAMAKSMLKSGNPDAVICSVYSGRSFGKEVLACMRKDGNQRIPVLMVGGEKHCEALRDAIELGADDYLAQHITAAEIIGKVKRLLNQRS